MNCLPLQQKYKIMDKNILQANLKELQKAYKRVWAIKQEIDTLKKESVEKNAIHKQGDIVSAYDDYGHYIGDGVVGHISTSLVIDMVRLDRLIDNADDTCKSIMRIRYEIFALNKNGTASKKHLSGTQHYFVDVKDGQSMSGYIIAK